MHPLELSLLQEWPLERWSGMRLVVAVSGGADSIALAYAVKRLCPANSLVIFAHFNHGLRGRESDEDEDFVRQFAQSLNCPFESNLPLEPRDPDQPPPRDEASLRSRRYAFLENCCRRLGARYLVLAHHADDQVETILHHFLRGSGLTGLCGMQAFRAANSTPDLVLARPLLQVTRHQILDYLQSHQQTFRQDSSNESTHYLRNWLRQEVMPKFDDRLGLAYRSAILHAASHLDELREWLEQLSEEAYHQAVVRRSANVIELDMQQLASIQWPVVHALLRRVWQEARWPLADMNSQHWNSIRSFLAIRAANHSANQAASKMSFDAVVRHGEMGEPPRSLDLQVMETMLPGGVQVQATSNLLRLLRSDSPKNQGEH